MQYGPSQAEQNPSHKPSLLLVQEPEPLPWELAQARPTQPTACTWPPSLSPAITLPPPLIVSDTTSFTMQALHDALPDPMHLEATLPTPVAFPAASHSALLAQHTAPIPTLTSS
jgi:hypothetical protein